MLSADLDRGLVEGPSQDALIDRGVRQQADDARLPRRARPRRRRRAGQGLYARLGSDALGLARCRRCATRSPHSARRASSRSPSTESFGEFGPGTRPYYLATAFDEIWLQPLGIGRADRAACRDAVPARHARPARHRRQLRPSRRIQERDEHFHRNRHDRAAARGDRRAARLRLGTDRARHRRGAQIAGERGRRADRPRPASSPTKRKRRGWSTGSAIATRRSPRRAARPGPAPSCCRCRAISKAPAGRMKAARRSR